MMAAILNSAILDLAILHKKNFSHSFWLNLMMATILNSAMLDSDTVILDSDTLFSSLRFTQNHSPCTLTLTQPNSIWLTRCWQPSCILPSWIQPCCTKKLHSCILTQLDNGIHFQFCYPGFSHFSPKKLLSFNLTQFDDGSHRDLCHLGFRHCHLGLKYLVIFSQIHSKTLSLHSGSDSN